MSKATKDLILTETSSSMFLMFGEINNDMARSCCEWILSNNYMSEEKPEVLHLLINSPGGDLNDAFAIIDLMKSSHIPIKTIGLGCIQSAGLMIFLAGRKGDRTLTPNTSIMSHQYAYGSAGKHHELIAMSKEFDLTMQRQLEHYKLMTGLKEKDILKHLLPSQDVWLSAAEAQKYGIADRVAFI